MPDVPASLEALIHQQLAFEPGARSGAARELANKLAETEHGARPQAMPAHPEILPAESIASGSSESASASQQIGEDLEEADFYYQQGLHGEAQGIYQRVLTLAPNHPPQSNQIS